MASIWAIADLHLSFGVENKSMDPFGPHWHDHTSKVVSAWKASVQPEDLVLIAGDISWAMTTEQAAFDLQWIHELPGTKMLLKGNHDYWWSSLAKVEKVLPSSMHLIQNNSRRWNDFVIGGARLWDTPEYCFNDWIEYRENPLVKKSPLDSATKLQEDAKIFQRELQRLEVSLKSFAAHPRARRIVMTHYPPIGGDLLPSAASKLLERYGVEVAVFGHLHNIKKPLIRPLFGEKDGIRYVMTAADYLDFQPIKIS